MIEIYEDFYPEVYAYVYRRVGSDRVDDVVANTFLTAWRRINDVPHEDEALYWLYRVAYRAIGTQWRSNARRDRLHSKLEAFGVAASPTPEDFLLQNDRAQLVIKTANKLKPAEREVLYLRFWEQLSHQEIASVVGSSPAAVKQRMHRAKKNFTKAYQQAVARNPDLRLVERSEA